MARGWYIAWLASEQEAFDPVAHRRRDVPIKSVSVREEEGVDAHACSIVTALMPSAMLAGKRWALLSYLLPNGTLVPVCRMRRKPIPAQETQGELALDFYARPSDWMTRRDVGLAPLRGRPFFEPLFVSASRQHDPVEILDGHRRIGHFDRVTGAFTTVEMLGVGLPVKRLTKRDLVGNKNGGGIRVRRTQEPLAGVQVQISMAWQQADDGYIDMTNALQQAFPDGAVGDPTGNGPSSTKLVPAGVVSTCTWESLESSMPKPGGSLGGASGYTVLQSTMVKIAAPPGAATITGRCNGQKARYDYTKETNLKTPIGLGFEITYGKGTLLLGYSMRQKREERVSFYVPNGNVAYADGAVETIVLRCEDPTIDTATQPWLPGQNVVAGDLRRVGIYVWNCLRPHLTAGNFNADLDAADGSAQWQLMNVTGAPSGTANLATWFGTVPGVATCVAAAHKALKKIALSQRSIEVRFVVPFEDWPDVSTAWACQVEVDDPLIPGGVAFGKVTAIEISQSSPKDYAKLAVTMVCCDGSGAAGPDQAHGINPSNEPWDGITLTSPLGFPVPATPIPGALIYVEDNTSQQVGFVQANDYTGVAPRNDRTYNDPKHLLGLVKTKLVISATPISGQPTLTVDYGLIASAWPGPAQIRYPEI